MPSELIQSLSVTNCSPGSPAWKRATKLIATATGIRLATAPTRPTYRAGAALTTSASASGNQMSIERVTFGSGGGDQEVEDHDRQAEDHRRGVEAQEPGLSAAHRGRPRAHDAADPAGHAARDHDPLQHRLREAADRERRADDGDVEQLVEVPLVNEEVVQPWEGG